MPLPGRPRKTPRIELHRAGDKLLPRTDCQRFPSPQAELLIFKKEAQRKEQAGKGKRLY
jgi:hypothetical protein